MKKEDWIARQLEALKRSAKPRSFVTLTAALSQLELRIKAEAAWVHRAGSDVTGDKNGFSESAQLRAMAKLIQQATADVDWESEIALLHAKGLEPPLILETIFRRHLATFCDEAGN